MQYVLSPKLLIRIAFKIFAFCCILIDGSDYYYYTDVTPLKAKNMLSTTKRCNSTAVIVIMLDSCIFLISCRYTCMHYSTMPTLLRQRLKLKDLVSEKQKLSVNLVKCHNYNSQ